MTEWTRHGLTAGVSTLLAFLAGALTNVFTNGWSWPVGIGLSVLLVVWVGWEMHQANQTVGRRPLGGRDATSLRQNVVNDRIRQNESVVPRQLPATPAHFVGRSGELEALNDLLRGRAETGGAVVISALRGAGGVGKTAVAIHWAHMVANRFPDGQLYVNLRGFDHDRPPMDPNDVTRRLLDALGVPSDRIPVDADALAALYRSELAGSRTLLILDNASDSAQVRPLLPGVSGCLVLVTSRNQLSGLVAADGAHPINLDMLPPDEARQLLAGRLGAERSAAEPDAIAEIVTMCAGLPLALVIVAARAVAHPRLSLRALAAQLRDSGVRRLDTLATDDPRIDVRAVFSWSYRALPAEAARLFRLLGLHRGSDISLPAAASLAHTPEASARGQLAVASRSAHSGTSLGIAKSALDVLTNNHLLEETSAGRYRFHDLVRAYAAECATDELEYTRNLATKSLLLWYLHAAAAATRHLYAPGRAEPASQLPSEFGTPPVPTISLDTQQQSMAWYDLEVDNIVAAVQQAAEIGQHKIACWLAILLRPYLQRRQPFQVWLTTHNLGLAAAQTAQDRLAEAEIHRGLGVAYYYLARYEDSRQHQQQALTLYNEVGRHGEIILVNLGSVAAALGLYDDSISYLQQALTASRTTGNKNVEAFALQSLGNTYQQLQRFDDAIAWCLRAVSMFEETKDLYGKGTVLGRLAYSYIRLRQLAEAIECLSEALALAQEIGDRPGEAWALDTLGTAHYLALQPDTAENLWLRALEAYDNLRDSDRAAMVQARLSSTEIAAADPRPRP